MPTDLPSDCSAYKSVPLPAEAEGRSVPKVFPTCASYRSYRGIGRRTNYAEARACAWQERQAQLAGLDQNQAEPTAWFVGGSLILADIYFNGAGVKRNIPLAMHFVCESEKGMVRLALPDIVKAGRSSSTSDPFEFCDYALSTMTMSFCSSYASQIDDDRRNRYYNSLKSSMSQDQQTAFANLLTAQSAYAKTHAREVDQGGTIRAIRTIGSENILNNLFHTEIVHFERRQWPTLSDKQIATADELLHREYQKKLKQLRTHTEEEIGQGAVTAEDLARVEASWEKYRKAWVAFAHLRYPTAAPAIRAAITLERYRLLRTIN